MEPKRIVPTRITVSSAPRNRTPMAHRVDPTVMPEPRLTRLGAAFIAALFILLALALVAVLVSKGHGA
jgi:hypothetical protein